MLRVRGEKSEKKKQTGYILPQDELVELTIQTREKIITVSGASINESHWKTVFDLMVNEPFVSSLIISATISNVISNLDNLTIQGRKKYPKKELDDLSYFI